MDDFQTQAQPTNTAYDLCASPNPLFNLIHDILKGFYDFGHGHDYVISVSLVQRHETLYIFVCLCVFCNNCDMHMILTYALIYYWYKSETNLFGSYHLLTFSNIFRVFWQKKKKKKKLPFSFGNIDSKVYLHIHWFDQ